MKSINKIVKLAMLQILTFAAAGSLVTNTLAGPVATPAGDMEKCYGIVKAGMNDCATSTQSCASSATKDRQPDAFVFLPKGDCNKIVGGSLTMPKSKPTE